MSLKSVEEHNREKLEQRRLREEAARKTGVACPKCGKELLWQSSFYMARLVYPPEHTRDAHCSSCSLTISLEV